MPRVKIVKMCPEHIPDVVRIDRESVPDPWSENAFISSMGYSNYIMLSAVDENDRAVGFIAASFVFGDINIDNFAVDKAFRRMGVGSMLLTELEGLVESFAECIHLEVRESNATAQSLYRTFGFEVDGMRKNFYSKPTENAVLMTKRV